LTIPEIANALAVSEHRRILVELTSQSKDLMSSPIVKSGELVNPFTCAVAESFAGKA
jgi:hypothetical protein